MAEKDKAHFGPAVVTIKQQFEAKRREQEAFKSFVPCRVPMQQHASRCPVFTQARATGGQAYWHRSRRGSTSSRVGVPYDQDKKPP